MTQTYTPSAPATSATWRSLRLGLLAGWAVFALGAVGFVAVIGTNAPYADEWEFVPALVGEEPIPAWLWKQHNEHRLPLPRLVFLVLFKLTHDFRAGMLFQVVILSALALGLMRLAESLRGRPHWADLFFPVSLLHIGHWENFVMGYQLCFALFCVLATGLAVTALRATTENAFRSGVVAGVLLLLLALTGGSGLAVIAPVSAWIAYLALGVWRSGAKGRGLLLFLLAALPLAYLGAYFVGYQKPEGHPDPGADLLGTARVTAEVLGVSFGIGLMGVWFVVCPAVVALGVATIVLLLRRRGEQPAERFAVVGLIAVAAGVAGVAAAIGVGRGGWGRDAKLLEGMGLWSRYSLLAWPLLATAYLAWVKLGRKWVPIALCVAAALAFPGNVGAGMMNGAQVKAKYSAIEADAAAGLSAEQIVARQFPGSQHAGQEKRAERGIPMLRAARIGIFAPSATPR
jgi:hypothetical protein